jgi:hypothetical protein
MTMKGNGSQRNAFRHTFWQAITTREFGEKVAREIRYLHEDRDTFPDSLATRTFTGPNALSLADTTADLLNNVIGRQIAKDNPKSSTQDLASKTLGYFRKEGLFTANLNRDGSVDVVQIPINKFVYERTLNNLMDVNKDGFKPAEQQERNKFLDDLNEKRREWRNENPR